MKSFLLFALFLTGFNGFAQQPVYTIAGTAFLQLADANDALQKIASGFGFLKEPAGIERRLFAFQRSAG